MFKVLPTNVAAPDVPVVVKVIESCLPLNVVQSVEESLPVFEPLAVGMFNVISPLVVTGLPETFISVPLVPVAKPTLVTEPAAVHGTLTAIWLDAFNCTGYVLLATPVTPVSYVCVNFVSDPSFTTPCCVVVAIVVRSGVAKATIDDNVKFLV